jgi:hypothetical protein
MSMSVYKYVCEKCNYKTNLKVPYERHLKSELHKTGRRKTRSDKICDVYECEKCKYTTTVGSNYKLHILNNHSTKEEKKIKFTFYCEECSFGTFGKSYFAKHLETIKHKRRVHTE